jgi:hypothetical protein
MKQDWKQCVLPAVLALGFLCMPVAAQDHPEARIDYPRASHDIQQLEVAINDAISKTFSNPFGLVHKPKGGYLWGYGYVFTFVVNIKWGMTPTPFGNLPRTGADITAEEKQQRIDRLKDELVKVLFSSGSGLAKLQDGESVAIMAFFEESNPLIPGGQANKTVVLSVLKSDLDQFANKQERFNEFKQKVKIIEY